MHRKVLLLSFRYPPYSHVGAYRWAKLSRKLAELGHLIDVCTVRWPDMGHSAWLTDVVHPSIQIHRIPSGHYQRLKYQQLSSRAARLIQWLLLRAEARLGPEDEARFWGAFLRPAVRRLMHAGPADVLIATGPPFSVLRVAAQIKAEFPKLRLIQDFRDPWVPSSSRDAARLARTLHAADQVVAVTPEMAGWLAQHGARSTACISNGFEQELVSKVIRPGEARYDFVHIGSIFNKRMTPLLRFLNWTRTRAETNRPVRVALIGRLPKRIQTEFADLIVAGLLIPQEQMSQERALEYVAQSRFALQLNAPNALTQVSTKIFEYAALRVPTVSVNYGGAVDSLVRNHGFGISIRATASDFEQRLDECMQLSSADFNYDVAPFSFERLAQQYSELIDRV